MHPCSRANDPLLQRVPNDGQYMDLLDANGAANDLGKIYLFE